MTANDNVEKTLALIERNAARYLAEFQRYLRQPAISTTGEGMREGAELTLRYVNALRSTSARLVEAGGHPAVLGKTSGGAPHAKTLLIYSFYDLVPVDGQVWASPPFEPTVIPPEQLGLPPGCGPVLCARGAIDHRGPTLATILGLQAIQEATGTLPVNVIFAIEGEEEIGSPHLRSLAEKYRPELEQAQAFWFPRFSQETPGGPMVVHRGYKGAIRLDLVSQSGEWGGALDRRDIWSANIAWVDAPMMRLVRALATLYDEDDRIAIDGFWDHVRPPGPHDLKEMAELDDTFDEETVKRSLKIARFKGGRSGRSWFRRYVLEPQMNVSLGAMPGLPGEEAYTKGVIDGSVKSELVMRARARLDFRLVPDLEPELVTTLLRAHLDRRGFHEIAVQRDNTWAVGYSWSRTEPTEAIYRALFRACKDGGLRPLVWPTMPSTCPIDVFNRGVLHLPMIAFGAGHGAWWHEANEYISVAAIAAFMKLMVRWLYAWADEPEQGG
jgi:acetylornithine deacetylase/succinyl-diaminopimelate desuccinylase-like protein